MELTGSDGIGPNGEKLDVHHTLPQFLEKWFLKLGINIHEPKYLVWYEKTLHQENSSAYTKDWESFLKEYEKNSTAPTIEQIKEYVRELAIRYGYELNF
jgi:hypothetical protein